MLGERSLILIVNFPEFPTNIVLDVGCFQHFLLHAVFHKEAEFVVGDRSVTVLVKPFKDFTYITL